VHGCQNAFRQRVALADRLTEQLLEVERIHDTVGAGIVVCTFHSVLFQRLSPEAPTQVQTLPVSPQLPTSASTLGLIP
jgi:hypothetical protein